MITQILPTAIASDKPRTGIPGIRPGLDKVAKAASIDLERSRRAAIEADWETGQNLLRMKTDLKRAEYNLYLAENGLSLKKANKYTKMAETFEDFELEQLFRLDSSILFSLSTKTCTGVVEQLREMPNLTVTLVEKLMKENRPTRKIKPKSDPVTGWKKNSDGEGRHYEVKFFDKEEIGLKVERLADEQKLRPEQIIEKALELYPPELVTYESQLSEYHKAQLDELQDVTTHVRSLLGEKQQLETNYSELEDRCSKLEVLCLEQKQKIIQLEELIKLPAPKEEITKKVTKRNFSNWTEVEKVMECDRSTLLDNVKSWTTDERQALSMLLAEHLEKNQSELDNMQWVPEKLLLSALSKLSFNVFNIGGANNLMDEPQIENVRGCQFVSLQHFGNPRRERWVFSGKDNKSFIVFGRNDFVIEAF